MIRPKFSKIYFPGLISLVFLPLMCIWYLVNNNNFHEYRAMDIAWMPKKELNTWVSRYGKKFDVETFRKYTLISITGNEKADAVAFSSLRSSFNQLAAKNDTINGIKLSFGGHASYGELIRALDFCLQDEEDQGLFLAPTGSEIFIARNGIAKPQPHKLSKLNNTDVHWVDDMVFLKPKPLSFSIEDGIRETFNALLRFWPSVLAFVLMLGFIILKKRRFLNLKTFRLVGH